MICSEILLPPPPLLLLLLPTLQSFSGYLIFVNFFGAELSSIAIIVFRVFRGRFSLSFFWFNLIVGFRLYCVLITIEMFWEIKVGFCTIFLDLILFYDVLCNLFIRVIYGITGVLFGLDVCDHGFS